MTRRTNYIFCATLVAAVQTFAFGQQLDVTAGQHRVLDGPSQSLLAYPHTRVGYNGWPSLSGATLSILNGASLSTGSLAIGSPSLAGMATFVTGTMRIDGTNSRAIMGLYSALGINSSGTLLVSNGGYFSSTLGNGASVGMVAGGRDHFAGSFRPKAYVRVEDAGSVIAITGPAVIASGGSDGTLVIRSGGRFTASRNPAIPDDTTACIIGAVGGSTGALTVEGAGSRCDIDGAISLGSGSGATLPPTPMELWPRGTAMIANGGLLTCDSFRIGNSGNSDLGIGIGTASVVSGGSIDASSVLRVYAGQLLIDGGSVTSDGTMLVSVGGPASVLFNAGELAVAGTLSFFSGGQMIMNSSSPVALQTGGVTFSGENNTARLDVGAGAVSVNYSAASPISQITTDVIRGRAGGTWNGPGISSATAAANANTHAVGIAEASETGLTSLFGESFDNTTVIVRYTLLGDATLDGAVNISDFANLAANFNQSGRWFTGDFDYSGTTNIADFALLAQNFNQSLPVSRSAVPEPTVAVAALFVIANLRRRAV